MPITELENYLYKLIARYICITKTLVNQVHMLTFYLEYMSPYSSLTFCSCSIDFASIDRKKGYCVCYSGVFQMLYFVGFFHVLLQNKTWTHFETRVCTYIYIYIYAHTYMYAYIFRIRNTLVSHTFNYNTMYCHLLLYHIRNYWW